MTAPDRERRPNMSRVAFSLPDDVLALVEKRAMLRFQGRSEQLRELIVAALLSNGSLKVKADA